MSRKAGGGGVSAACFFISPPLADNHGALWYHNGANLRRPGLKVARRAVTIKPP